MHSARSGVPAASRQALPGVNSGRCQRRCRRSQIAAAIIITDLVEAGYVVKEKDGRRNRYHVQAHLPLPEPTARERTVGEVLALLTGTDATATGKPPAELGTGREKAET